MVASGCACCAAVVTSKLRLRLSPGRRPLKPPATVLPTGNVTCPAVGLLRVTRPVRWLKETNWPLTAGKRTATGEHGRVAERGDSGDVDTAARRAEVERDVRARLQRVEAGHAAPHGQAAQAARLVDHGDPAPALVITEDAGARGGPGDQGRRPAASSGLARGRRGLGHGSDVPGLPPAGVLDRAVTDDHLVAGVQGFDRAQGFPFHGQGGLAALAAEGDLVRRPVDAHHFGIHERRGIGLAVGRVGSRALLLGRGCPR